MANIKSQIKRNRQTEKRNLRNRKVRSELHTRTKTALSAIDEGSDDADEAVRQAIKRIDRAAQRGVLHKNTAARRKARLAPLLAAFGIVSKIWLRHRFPKIAMASYLIMGWLVVIAAPELADAVGSGGIAWLVAGGVSYTVGALFYSIRSLRFNHAIWHVFVLIGGICHFLAVALHVLPVPGAIGIA